MLDERSICEADGHGRSEFMKIENLKLLLAVAESGSINKTAEQNFLTHQSLGVILKSLEKELNCTLFIRTNKGVALSAEGKEFLPYARQAVNAIDAYKALHPVTISEILHLYTTPGLANYIRILQKDIVAEKYYLSIHEHNIEELSVLMNQSDASARNVYFFPVLQHEKYENPSTDLAKIIITKDETITDICHEKNPILHNLHNLNEALNNTIIIVGSSYSAKGNAYKKRKRINISDIDVCKKMMLEQGCLYSGPKTLCQLQFPEPEWKILRENPCPAIEFSLFYHHAFADENRLVIKELSKMLKTVFKS